MKHTTERMASEGEVQQIDREMLEARAELARARVTLMGLRYAHSAAGLREAWAAQAAAEERFRLARIRSHLAGIAPRARD